MDHILVTPADLRTHWPVISEGLDAVLAKGEEDWIKEDVYVALRTGQAACYMAFGDNGYGGLMVVNPVRAEFSGQSTLHVWVAHSVGGQDVIETGIGILRDVATRAGCQKVTFASSRPGWSKKYKLVTAVYEVEI